MQQFASLFIKLEAVVKPAEKLEAALVAAFPAEMIDRAMIDEPSARWVVHDATDLADFERQTWLDLAAPLLVRNSSLLVYAGDRLFHATLPAYLRYLVRERQRFNDLPFQVASQLTRGADPESHPKFERRVAAFTAAQRLTIHDVIALLATVPPMEPPMSRALETWNQLQGKGRGA